MSNSQKTILIVDDDTDYLFQVKHHVEKMGFNVVTAESQREAESILKNLKPDLAILDLMMENEDSGFILCYKLKRMYPEVPVIIATAVSAETGMGFGISTEQERQWIKADQYMEKGIRPDQLNREIMKLLRI
ncbi:MAG TPA: response regulator [Bacteroidales bacterium]|nr:response regulator [Bacteroidales bacterium]